MFLPKTNNQKTGKEGKRKWEDQHTRWCPSMNSQYELKEQPVQLGAKQILEVKLSKGRGMGRQILALVVKKNK